MLTYKQVREILKLVMEHSDVFDSLKVTQQYVCKTGEHLDWHPVSDFLDQVRRDGFLELVSPGGFCTYRLSANADLQAILLRKSLSLFEMFKQFAVSGCQSVDEFALKYYKPERYSGRGDEYASICLNHLKEDVRLSGYCILSNFESITGDYVAFYPVPTMAENEVVTCFEDACPVHGGEILEEHSFGMLGEMTVFTFDSCCCACSSNGWPDGMRYHSSFALAAGAAQMQVEMDAIGPLG